MATLGEMHDLVRGALSKGTAYDGVIPSRVRFAARWIERNYTFQYMKRIGSFTVDLLTEFPWAVPVPNKNWKAIDYLRIVADDGNFYPVVLDPNPKEQLSFPTGRPEKYILDGTERLILNAVPDQAYYMEMFFTEFTSWPTEASADNWLLANAEDLLLFQTMLEMSVHLRDSRMADVYKGARDEALKTIIDTDMEMTQSNSPLVMGFVPEGGFD